MAKPRPCVVPCCQGEKFELVHKFPSDRERAELWKGILGVPELGSMDVDLIRARYFVCTRHFRDADYKNKVSRSLNITANPSLNLVGLWDEEGLNRVIPPMLKPVIVGQQLSRVTAEKASTPVVTVSLEVKPVNDEQRRVQIIDQDTELMCIYDPISGSFEEASQPVQLPTVSVPQQQPQHLTIDLFKVQTSSKADDILSALRRVKRRGGGSVAAHDAVYDILIASLNASMDALRYFNL